MPYIKLTIRIGDHYHESLIAELIDLDFDGFEQFDDRLVTYISHAAFNDVFRERIEQLLLVYPGENYIETEEIDDQNWNEAWEKTIQPFEVGPFLIKPTWSGRKAGKGQVLLEIDPKMSFGTGTHTTTQLMLEILTDLDPEGKSVLDVGTGTGILAIAAAKLGAKRVVAADIDEWSVTNARENALINRVGNRIDIVLGGIEVLPENRKFDLLLANINRNVIVDLFGLFIDRLNTGGELCVTGLLQRDAEAVLELGERYDAVLTGEKSEEEWVLLRFRKQR